MSFTTCALCPRLCRSACPVATGSGREAAVPAVIAGTMLDAERGNVPAALAREALTLCTDCGACQEHCHLHVPLPQLLREARAERVPRPALEPLQPIHGTGDWIAIESDDRPFAEALSKALGKDVRKWRTSDHLGVETLAYPGFEERLERIRGRIGNGRVVVVSGGVARVLEKAGVGYQWLHEVVRDLPGGDGSCALGGNRPLACCGAAGPLAAFHPDDAERTGRVWLDRSEEWVVRDARCRSHLNRCGGTVQDPLDALIARVMP
ncbi:MAG: (Fe-S)-binding protein [Alphaproteobacteria bacterium]|nr:(Fe-S)-binding protein [Alphaproteobacteria bacterium]